MAEQREQIEKILRGRLLFIGDQFDEAPPIMNLRGIQIYFGSLNELIEELLAAKAPRQSEQWDWQTWREELLDAWRNDYRATMTALLESGPSVPTIIDVDPAGGPDRTAFSFGCPICGINERPCEHLKTVWPSVCPGEPTAPTEEK